MSSTAAQTLITNAIGSFGIAALSILGFLISLILGLLVFRWGLRKAMNSEYWGGTITDTVGNYAYVRLQRRYGHSDW